MKDAGVISKIKDGVKILAKGVDRFRELNVPLNLEITDASSAAVEAIKQAGGNLTSQYRTPLLMRYHMAPHKFSQHKTLKTPMPPAYKVRKLEKLRDKGIDVNYPKAPWYTDNLEKIKGDIAEKERRLRESPNAKYLPRYPADRSPNPNHIRVEKSNVHIKFKLPN